METTRSPEMPMPDDILASLQLTPADVPDLPAKARTTLIAYLLRWEHYDAACRCLQQLLATHSHLVSVYDSLARAHLGLGQPKRGVEIMRRRHALRRSNSSRALEARVHLAAGSLGEALSIARELVTEQPDLLLTWNLQADLCLATGDLEGAESSLHQQEALQPEGAATARGLARLWQARGSAEKALLWARTAVSRSERDERRPSVDLLRLLETLYRVTGHLAQAEAIVTRLRQRRQQELGQLRQTLGLPLRAAGPQRTGQPASHPAKPPADPSSATTTGSAVTGTADLTRDERTQLDTALRRHFAHNTFRPGQTDVIATILRGESVLAVMPTGAGKSLCYQLAALLMPGTTLIISPLIALMKDQLDGLPAGVASLATTLNSTLDSAELGTRLAHAATGGFKLLYVAPERLRQQPFLHALKRAGVSLLVVDEAHCVSLWGHDFRPDYLFIAKAWRELGEPPILAMTATATPRVRDDIQAALSGMHLVAIDVHRPNLCLEARHFARDAEKQRALVALCREIEGSGIVYASSRLKCEELARMLRRNGVSAIHYHAGIEDRAAAQDRFMNDEARVVVATVAFGMGVDKADVRFIVHYQPPKALENYYQEAGRAGRDGLPARCILFHTPADKGNLTRWTREDAMHVEFLRTAYAAIQARLGAESLGRVTVGDLERDLVADETHLRVAIHFLETAGLLWRGFDLPRTATLSLHRPLDGNDHDFARFVAAARLRPDQTVSRDLLALSREAGFDPRSIEDQLLAWDCAGWLRYRGIGRDMLLALPDPPAESRQRVAAMLADFRAGQDGRIAEMMAYARTRTCRHGHISAYFGGRPIDHCEACDNCLGLASRHPQPIRRRLAVSKPTPVGDPVRIILQGVTQLPFPLGRKGLARALQGASTSPVQDNHFPLFGALADHTQRRIGELVLQLVDQGLLAYFERSGYRLLRITDEGQSWLAAPHREPDTITPPTLLPAEQHKESSQTETLSDCAETLFEQLRAWRLDMAREIGKPPYVVFHNSVLRDIAAFLPANLQELAAIRGIGPRKLQQYGEAVLEIVATRRSTPGGENVG
jgi:ATP-dependent DNA helicase RecQ